MGTPIDPFDVDEPAPSARLTARRRIARACSSLVIAAALMPVAAGADPLRASLDAGASQAEVVALLGDGPLGCTSGSEREVCTWRIDADSPHFDTLSSDPAIPAPLHVVCDFPTRPAETARESAPPSRCTVHERVLPRSRNRRAPATRATPIDARRGLDEAQTLAAISHLVGAGPEDCVQRDDAEWVCAWRAEPHDPGHAVLGKLAETSAAARLVCRLPLEGGAREADSCRARRAD